MASIDLWDQHTNNFHPDREAPAIYRTVIYLQGPKPQNGPRPSIKMGKIFPDKNMHDDHPEDGNSDFITSRIVIHRKTDWWPRVEIENTVHYHDAHGKRQVAKVIATFDDYNIVAAIGCENLSTNRFAYNRAVVKIHFDVDIGQPEERETWETYLGEGSETPLHRVMINVYPMRRGINLWSEQVFGTSQPIIEAFRDRILKARNIVCFAIGNGIQDEIRACSERIVAARLQDPLRKWLPRDFSVTKSMAAISLNTGQMVAPQSMIIDPQVNFKYFLMWQIMHGYGIKIEADFERKAVIKLPPMKAIVVGLNGYRNDKFMLLLQWEGANASDYRPRPGDTIEVAFHAGENPSQRWKGEVAQPFTAMRLDQICIYIIRPRKETFDKEIQPLRQSFYTSESELLPHITFDELTNLEAASLRIKINQIYEAQTRESDVTIQLFPVYNDQSVRRLWKAIDVLGVAHKPHHRRLQQFLMGQAPSDLPRKSLFVSEVFDDPRLAYARVNNALSEKQAEVIDATNDAAMGIVLTNSPAGTGKTMLAVRLAAAIVCQKSLRKVLIASSIDKVVDTLYLKQYHAIHEWVKEYPVERNNNLPILCCRFYSVDTEKAVIERDARIDLEMANDICLKQEEQFDMIQIAESVAKNGNAHHESASTRKFPHIRDPCVQILDATLGEHMAIRAGLRRNLDGTLYPWANWDKHKFFRDKYHEYRQPNISFTAEEQEAFTKSISKLREDTLSIISVIATTLSNSSLDRIHLFSEPELIILDEIAHSLEAESIIPFVWYPSARCTLFLGDSGQLRPFVRSNVKYKGVIQNPFAPQLRLSLFNRLQLAGFKTIFLDQQYRFCEDIMKVISPTFYEDRLKLGTIDKSEVEKYRSVNERALGKASNVLMVNVDNTIAVRSPVNPSRYTSWEATATIEILSRYLDNGIPPEKIGLLTPYENQWALLRRGVEALSEHRKQDLSNVLVAKFDEVSGDERDMLIISLTTVDELEFLRSRFRINTALSRAKYSLVVVCNFPAISKNNRIKYTKLMKALLLMRPHQVYMTEILRNSTVLTAGFPALTLKADV